MIFKLDIAKIGEHFIFRGRMHLSLTLSPVHICLPSQCGRSKRMTPGPYDSVPKFSLKDNCHDQGIQFSQGVASLRNFSSEFEKNAWQSEFYGNDLYGNFYNGNLWKIYYILHIVARGALIFCLNISTITTSLQLQVTCTY